jgi:tetratricopeptide (TPR) repeat protein
MEPVYDVFLSYSRDDAHIASLLGTALTRTGLRAFVDTADIAPFQSITSRISEALKVCKAMLIVYSTSYPGRRACQWELTQAFIMTIDDPQQRDRIMVVNCADTFDHIQPVELRDALSMPAPRDADEADRCAEAVSRAIAVLTGSIGDGGTGRQAKWFRGRREGSSRFVGRLPELWRVHSALNPRKASAHTGSERVGAVQITGMGGVGKSLLAEEYALRMGAAYPGGIFWLNARSGDTTDRAPLADPNLMLADELASVAASLGVDTRETSADQLWREVITRIEAGEGDCLWVVDDLPERLSAEQVRQWIPRTYTVHTIITTRSRDYDAISPIVDLSGLPHDDGHELLISRRQPAEGDVEQAHMIVDDLGGHPLAIDVAGALLHAQAGFLTWSGFRADLNDRSDDKFEILLRDLGSVLPNGHERSIARTLWRSIALLAEDAPGRAFLRFAANLATVPIPASLITEVFAAADAAKGADAVPVRTMSGPAGVAVSQAESLSLAARVDELGENWEVHTLISRVVRFAEGQSPHFTVARATVLAALSSALLEGSRGAPASLDPLIPHARALADSVVAAEEGEIIDRVADIDQERGHYGAALAAYERLRTLYVDAYGDQDARSIGLLHEMALALLRSGSPRRAETLMFEALELYRLAAPLRSGQQVESEGASDGLPAAGAPGGLVNLAQSLVAQHRYALGRELLEKADRQNQEELGEHHPMTLRTLDNIASSYFEEGYAAKARPLGEKALAGLRRAAGDDHPDTIITMSNLACTMIALDEIGKGLSLAAEAYERAERIFGEDNRATLAVGNTLSGALAASGDVRGAASLRKQMLERARRLFPPEHPDVMAALYSYANSLFEMGDEDGGLDIEQQAMQIESSILRSDAPQRTEEAGAGTVGAGGTGGPAGTQGTEDDAATAGPLHPQVAERYLSVAGDMLQRGEHLAAMDRLRQVVTSFQEIYGEDHPKTLMAWGSVGSALVGLGANAEAKGLLKRLIPANTEVFGETHNETLAAMANYGQLVSSEGSHREAEPLLRHVFNVRRDKLGFRNKRTLLAAANLAQILRCMGSIEAAYQLQLETLQTSIDVLGERHRDTLAVADNLAITNEIQRQAGELATIAASLAQRLEREVCYPRSVTQLVGLALAYTERSELGRAAELLAPLHSIDYADAVAAKVRLLTAAQGRDAASAAAAKIVGGNARQGMSDLFAMAAREPKLPGTTVHLRILDAFSYLGNANPIVQEFRRRLSAMLF